jgi:hypothetical protein
MEIVLLMFILIYILITISRWNDFVVWYEARTFNILKFPFRLHIRFRPPRPYHTKIKYSSLKLVFFFPAHVYVCSSFGYTDHHIKSTCMIIYTDGIDFFLLFSDFNIFFFFSFQCRKCVFFCCLQFLWIEFLLFLWLASRLNWYSGSSKNMMFKIESICWPAKVDQSILGLSLKLTSELSHWPTPTIKRFEVA